jgi:antitoxin MazE
MQTVIAKWGNSLALRLPRHLAAAAKLHDGTSVELTVEGGNLVIRPSRPKYQLADLLRFEAARVVRSL